MSAQSSAHISLPWYATRCWCGHVIDPLHAHDMSYLQAAMAWNHDGTLLASASDKGTVLRVHTLPQVSSAARSLSSSVSLPHW